MKKLSALPLLILFAAGCASKPPVVNIDTVSPRFSTAYAGGQMSISWNSAPNQIYTIFYTDAPRNQRPDWKPLPQADRIQGTGKQIEVVDKPATGDVRRYLLMTGDQKPY
ncbi:MAG: hypothetical protein WC959_04245 [Kiritimatiellales bacterium]